MGGHFRDLCLVTCRSALYWKIVLRFKAPPESTAVWLNCSIRNCYCAVYGRLVQLGDDRTGKLSLALVSSHGQRNEWDRVGLN